MIRFNRQFLPIITALILSACVTTPNVPPPAIFTGQSGFVIKQGSTKVISNNVSKNEAFASRDVDFRRTGVITEDVRYGNILSPTIKAGTKVYAANYGYGGVGWCVPGIDSEKFMDGVMGNTIADCILWKRNPGSAYRLNGKPGQSPFFSPKLSGQPAYGKTPNIKEEKVDFGRDFSIELVFRKIKKEKVFIDTVFFDGKNRATMRSDQFPIMETGKAEMNMWGGKFQFSPLEEEKMSVNVIKAPTDEELDMVAIRELLIQALQEQNEREKSSNEP